MMRFSALLALGCALAAGPVAAQLRVAASTTFVGELVTAVGGTNVSVRTIYPRDADPHAYEPKPGDVARLSGARIVFLNGLGLESALRGPLESLKAEGATLVEVSRGITPRHDEDGHEGHDHAVDPHVWYDPVALMTWATNLAAELTRIDSANAAGYAQRAQETAAKFGALDQWIRERFAAIPKDRRVLVTDHESLGYFADRYGLRIAGAVLPGVSTLAEPSARDVAALQKVIAREKVRALFVGGSSVPALVQRLAADTGVRIVGLPTCALGAEGSETGTLDGYLRSLTRTLVEGLSAP